MSWPWKNALVYLLSDEQSERRGRYAMDGLYTGWIGFFFIAAGDINVWNGILDGAAKSDVDNQRDPLQA